MHEILDHLEEGAVVLDLGCGSGSFEAPGRRFRTVYVDRDWHRLAGFVQADAGRLPFRDGTFDAVVANHSLEHFEALDKVLGEVGRVVKPGGALFVAVPDAGTLCDRLYRWLGRGGGHVNAFRSAEELARRISQRTGLRHAGTRTLCTSLSWMNRRGSPERRPRRMWLVGGGYEPVLVWWSSLARLADRRLGTRWAVYGWALWFGAVSVGVGGRAASNVCARCGAGHASEWLLGVGSVQGHWYRCPGCGARNRFTKDEQFRY